MCQGFIFRSYDADEHFLQLFLHSRRRIWVGSRGKSQEINEHLRHPNPPQGKPSYRPLGVEVAIITTTITTTPLQSTDTGELIIFVIRLLSHTIRTPLSLVCRQNPPLRPKKATFLSTLSNRLIILIQNPSEGVASVTNITIERIIK